MSYQPFYISSFENDSGLDQYYESFLIPEKAFPTLEDAFAWRGRVRRRDGFAFLGRLRRLISQVSITTTDGTATYSNPDILSSFRPDEPNAEIVPKAVVGLVIVIARGGGDQSVYNDVGGGSVVYVSGTYTISSGTINYVTGELILNFTVPPAAGKTVDISTAYYPGLPVMGLPTLETRSINDEKLIAFDQFYAYIFDTSSGLFKELPATTPTTWNGNNSDFFWSINYFQDAIRS